MITYDKEFIEKYSYLLTPEVMESMPRGISDEAQLRWKIDKIRILLKIQQFENDAANNIADDMTNGIAYKFKNDAVSEVKNKTASNTVEKTQPSSKSNASAKKQDSAISKK